jgi:hypothetical protein
MTSIKNHKTLSAIVAITAIAVVLTGSVHLALAFRGGFFRSPGNSITTDNEGVNVQTDTNQTQGCQTGGEMSGITDSCQASSADHVTQSGGTFDIQEKKVTQGPQGFGGHGGFGG